MTATDFDRESVYDHEKFSPAEAFQSECLKVVCGYFRSGQFFPPYALRSDGTMHVRSGTGLVRDGEEQYSVDSGDAVDGTGTEPGGKADKDSRVEALLVTVPSAANGEHEPVREGPHRNEFHPHNR